MYSLEATTNARHPELIYVVEDDIDVSRLIEHNLRTAGYEVSTFLSGAPVVPSGRQSSPGALSARHHAAGYQWD